MNPHTKEEVKQFKSKVKSLIWSTTYVPKNTEGSITENTKVMQKMEKDYSRGAMQKQHSSEVGDEQGLNTQDHRWDK